MRHLRALTIEEERTLAGRVAGLLYLTGAATLTVMTILPGIEVRDSLPVLAIAAAALVWGLVCLFLLPWQRIHPLVSHFSSAAGLPLTALAIYYTGGSTSPADLYLFFVVVYVSYFYPPKEAIPHLLACVAVVALPLAYDENAIENGLLGELLVLLPTYLVLGGLIMRGKAVLVELSHADSLTGLANRRAFVETIHARTAGRRRDDGFGLMLIDLDGFKDANTIYGHPGGDDVLCHVAEALRGAIRDGDTVARLGGDEFAIIAAGVGEREMELLRDRVRARLETADRELGLADYRVRGSFGWALFPRDSTCPDELFVKADLALLAAKAGAPGRGGARPERAAQRVTASR